MRVAYVGNFSQRHCTEVHLAATLEDLGHTVTRIQENATDPATLLSIVDGHDLFLFTRTWDCLVTLEHLEAIRGKGIVSASYHLDLYLGLRREQGLETDPFWRTDFVFTPDGAPESQAAFEAKGINHHYMKPGVYKGECYIATPGSPLANDVVFVGGGSPAGEEPQYGHHEWPYRGQLLKWLRDTYGERYSKYGWPQETIRNEALNSLYSGSKVVVGDSLCLNFEHPYYWSDRVYETLGRGGFIIHPYIKGMEEEFTDRHDIVFYEYGNFDQLKSLIDYYLEHEEERLQIRDRGHNLVKHHCTYHNRLTQMLEVISASTGMPTLPGAPPIAPIKINLGCGKEPTEGWVNVDWIAQEGVDVVHNLLSVPWPFGDGVAEEIKAIDVLEHMPNYTPDLRSTPIAFIEECWRILQPGGKLTLQVPHWNSPKMWIDPTHVRGYDPQSFDYFDPDTDYGEWYGYYSQCKFKVAASEANGNLTFEMVKR